MSLPKKFDRRVKTALNLHAVWEPGSEVKLGDVLTRHNGIFTDVARLQDFGVGFRRVTAGERSLNLDARGVRTTIVQGGVEVDAPELLESGPRAEVEVSFERKNTYFLRTSSLKGQEIDDLLQVGRKVRDLDDWRYGEYYIVTKLLKASKFTFLGSLSKNRTVSFSGQGRYVKALLTVGANTRLRASGTRSLDVEIVGKGGPIVMGVARIRRDGRVVIV